MTRITRKEAGLAVLGMLLLAGIYVSIAMCPPLKVDFAFLNGMLRPGSISWLDSHFARLVGFLKDFALSTLPSIAAVLLGTIVAYTFIINRGKRYDVFLSVPMSTATQYDAVRLFVTNIQQRVLKHGRVKSIYNPMDAITRPDMMDSPKVSIEKDILALDRSAYYVLILPQPLPSSVYFEAGYAFCRRMTCLYFVKNVSDLPYIMREPQATHRVEIIPYQTEDNIVEALQNYPFKF